MVNLKYCLLACIERTTNKNLNILHTNFTNASGVVAVIRKIIQMKTIAINYEKLKNNKEWSLLCESIYKEGVYIKSYQVSYFTTLK